LVECLAYFVEAVDEHGGYDSENFAGGIGSLHVIDLKVLDPRVVFFSHVTDIFHVFLYLRIGHIKHFLLKFSRSSKFFTHNLLQFAGLDQSVVIDEEDLFLELADGEFGEGGIIDDDVSHCLFDDIDEVVIIELEVVFAGDRGGHEAVIPWEVCSVHLK